MLKINHSRDYFLTDNGEKFFYLADTVWSAFTNASLEDWEEYLNYRARQGFNALQINILRQWDASESNLDLEPFLIDKKGNYDYFSYNEEYFSRAGKMIAMAVKKGFIPALVVLWCNYVPDTWAARMEIIKQRVMPEDAVQPYVEYLVNQFGKYNPIYIISGDTDFPSKRANDYYMTALETIKNLTPEALTTMHLGSSPQDLHEDFVRSKDLDFYMYQSGHGFDHGVKEGSPTYGLAEKFYNKPVKRPIINGEPCYEGMGISGKYGRFKAFDVRKAIWQSLLSGAKAGVTYGAHGLWSWHKEGQKFIAEEFWGKPFDVKEAVRMEGSWDASFAKNIFETYDLFDLNPLGSINNPEIRIAGAENKFAIYVPYSADIELNQDLRNYDIVMIDLTRKNKIIPDIEISGGKTVIKMLQANTDVVIIGQKQ